MSEVTGCGTSLRERSVLQSIKVKEVGDLKIILALDIQKLEFSLLVFGFALFLYFLTMYHFLLFGMYIYSVIYTFHVYIFIYILLKVYNLFFDLTGNLQLRVYLESQKKL